MARWRRAAAAVQHRVDDGGPVDQARRGARRGVGEPGHEAPGQAGGEQQHRRHRGRLGQPVAAVGLLLGLLGGLGPLRGVRPRPTNTVRTIRSTAPPISPLAITSSGETNHSPRCVAASSIRARPRNGPKGGSAASASPRDGGQHPEPRMGAPAAEERQLLQRAVAVLDHPER